MNHRSFLALAALAAMAIACDPAEREGDPNGHTHGRYELGRKIALPSGAALFPDDAEAPGEAKPQGVLVSGGKVYVALTNLHQAFPPYYSPAGAGAVAIYDAATLELERTVSLKTGDATCLNPGALALAADRVLVPCSGNWNDDGAVASFKLDGTDVVVKTTGSAPGSIAVSGTTAWLGDLMGGSLLAVKTDLSEVLHGNGGQAPVEVCPVGDATWEMVGAVTVVDGRGYAACFGNDRVQAFDPATGEIAGDPLNVGDGPTAFALLVKEGQKELLVVNGLGATLTAIALGDAPAVREALTLGQGPQSVAVSGTKVAVTNSDDGTVTVIDASSETFRKVDSVNLKAAGGGTNFPYDVAFSGNDLLVSLNGTGELAVVKWVVTEEAH